MKKRILISILFFPFMGILHAQNKFNELSGAWIVDSIINIQDNSRTFGKFAELDEFIKFTFENKTTLFVSNSPFELGIKVPISVQKSEISVVPENVYPQQLKNMGVSLPAFPMFSESKYIIDVINTNSLKLKTINENKDSIMYCFSRLLTSNKDSINLNFSTFYINHLDYGRSISRLVKYNFKIGRFKYMIPIYKNNPSFGIELNSILNLRKELTKGEPSSEFVIKIKINKDGKVENARVIKGINENLDNEILKFFKKSKWESLNYNIYGIMTFHMILYITDSKLN